MTSALRLLAAAISILTAACGTLEPGKRDQPSADVQAFPIAETLPELDRNEVARLNTLRRMLHAAGELGHEHAKEFDTLRRKYRLRGLLGAEPAEDAAFQRRLNSALLSYYRDVESRAYRSGAERPHTCVALSGGGLRSASISMGVLAELGDRGWLSRADVYSSVSGGGYALGRLFVNASSSGRPVIDVARDTEFTDGVSPNIEPAWLNVGFALASKFLGLQLFTSGVSVGNFNNGFDSTLEKTVYGTDVRSAFGYPFFHSRQTLIDYVTSRREGIPLFNVAAFPVAPSFSGAEGDALLHTGFNTYGLDETLLEFTPLRIGAPAAGYSHHWPVPMQGWSDVVAVSGAAPDSPFKKVKMPIKLQIGGLMQLVLPGLHLPPSSGRPNEVSGFVQRFFATDGGFVDNTGIASLVRRGCERIVALDATYDPAWTFESFGILKQRLAAEHAMTIGGDLNSYWDACTNKAARPDGVLVPNDPPSCAQGTTLLRDERHSQSVSSTGFTARVNTIPIADALGARKDLQPTIIYLKTGLTPASRALPAISSWLAICTSLGRACPFPMDTTETLAYQKGQYQAYVELGRQLVRENAGMLETHLR